MPPDIAKAIVSVMAKIKPLSKDSKNQFQKYDFVSVDQFYEAVGPLMAEAGIFILPFEVSAEVAIRSSTDDRGNTKESAWLSAVYDIMIYHESGSKFGPVRRSTQVAASGAQSYASAQSFIEKYFLRTLFKIPTGEPDADADAKHTLPAKRVELLNPLQVDMIQEALDKLGGDAEEGLFRHMGVKVVSAIRAVDYNYVQEVLAKKLQAKEKLASQLLASVGGYHVPNDNRSVP